MNAVIGRAQIAWWVIVIAVICFYVTGLVMTVFNPLQMWVLTGVVIVLVALFARHLVTYSRMLRDDKAPGHDELRRTLNSMRETRGF
jgi:fatty acid desaturase